MTPWKIKQELNSAQAELKRCYRELRSRNTTVNNLVNEYTEAIAKSNVLKSSYCLKQDTDPGGTCYFQCDECKMKLFFQRQRTKQSSFNPDCLYSIFPAIFRIEYMCE